jgi:hypothetical protein
MYGAVLTRVAYWHAVEMAITVGGSCDSVEITEAHQSGCRWLGGLNIDSDIPKVSLSSRVIRRSVV